MTECRVNPRVGGRAQEEARRCSRDLDWTFELSETYKVGVLHGDGP